jgi:hypothetical protein
MCQMYLDNPHHRMKYEDALPTQLDRFPERLVSGNKGEGRPGNRSSRITPRACRALWHLVQASETCQVPCNVDRSICLASSVECLFLWLDSRTVVCLICEAWAGA